MENLPKIKNGNTQRILTNVITRVLPVAPGEQADMALQFRTENQFGVSENGKNMESTFSCIVTDRNTGRLHVEVTYKGLVSFEEEIQDSQILTAQTYMISLLFPYCRMMITQLLRECCIEEDIIDKIVPPANVFIKKG